MTVLVERIDALNYGQLVLINRSRDMPDLRAGRIIGDDRSLHPLVLPRNQLSVHERVSQKWHDLENSLAVGHAFMGST